jgi:hypothetical protein
MVWSPAPPPAAAAAPAGPGGATAWFSRPTTQSNVREYAALASPSWASTACCPLSGMSMVSVAVTIVRTVSACRSAELSASNSDAVVSSAATLAPVTLAPSLPPGPGRHATPQ